MAYSPGISTELQRLLQRPKCEDWAAKVQTLCESFWKVYASQEPETVEACIDGTLQGEFVQFLKEDEVFPLAQLVIPELRTAGKSPTDNHYHQRVLAETQDRRDAMFSRHSCTLASNDSDAAHTEKTILADAELNRIRLFAHHSGQVTQKEEQEIVEWLAKCPLALQKLDKEGARKATADESSSSLNDARAALATPSPTATSPSATLTPAQREADNDHNTDFTHVDQTELGRAQAIDLTPAVLTHRQATLDVAGWRQDTIPNDQINDRSWRWTGEVPDSEDDEEEFIITPLRKRLKLSTGKQRLAREEEWTGDTRQDIPLSKVRRPSAGDRVDLIKDERDIVLRILPHGLTREQILQYQRID